jgi:RNA ligase (TIGR02306 family)
MSAFHVKVRKIKIVPHLKADRLEVAVVDDYQSCVRKGDFADGDLAIYIPEGAVLPPYVLKEVGLWDEAENKGTAAGEQGDRIHAVRLRDVLSQGVLLSIPGFWRICDELEAHDALTIEQMKDFSFYYQAGLPEGEDVQHLINVTKYIPELPPFMEGDIMELFDHTRHFDLEDEKRFPNALIPGEEVVMTEKLHGLFCQIGVIPGLNNERLLDGNMFATSKGFANDGIVFENTERNTVVNVYHKTLLRLQDKFKALAMYVSSIEVLKQMRDSDTVVGDQQVFILGEIFGMGSGQDLHYGLKEVDFRVFDIYVGPPTQGRYLDYDEVVTACTNILETVPLLYRGPYDKATILQHREGKTTFGGSNVLEGGVVKPTKERRDLELGRVILKFINPDYLTRKGKKGQQVTEYT